MTQSEQPVELGQGKLPPKRGSRSALLGSPNPCEILQQRRRINPGQTMLLLFHFTHFFSSRAQLLPSQTPA